MDIGFLIISAYVLITDVLFFIFVTKYSRENNAGIKIFLSLFGFILLPFLFLVALFITIKQYFRI